MKKHPTPEFGRKLKYVRKGRKISQEKLSCLCLISRPYISSLENDMKQPLLGMVFTIADGLSMKASELVKEMEKPSSKQHDDRKKTLFHSEQKKNILKGR